jgi:ketol-acid reductoisomerase
MTTIVEKLNALAELCAAIDVMAILKQDEIDKVLTPEIKSALDAIEAEFAPKFAAAETNFVALKAEIETEVLAAGKSISGTHVRATYIKGRAGGWDSGKLEGFAMAHPEILAARKPDGKPTVRFDPLG